MSKTFTWSWLGEGMSFLSSLKVNGGRYKSPTWAQRLEDKDQI